MNSNEGNGPGQGGGGQGSDHGGGHGGVQDGVVFTIKLDREQFRVTERVMTGAQIRALPKPDVPPDRDLFEVVPGGSDRKIEINDRVEMRDGLRFFTAPAVINPGQA